MSKTVITGVIGNNQIKRGFFQVLETMRKLLILITLLLTFGFSKAQNVSRYLLELETYTKWDAVDNKWSGIRNDWVSNCNSDNSPERSAYLLLVFESHVKWSAVEENWKVRRDSWVAECNKATTNTQVARLLLDLEANIKWKAC